VLGGLLLRHALRVVREGTHEAARGLFLFSILYLFLIFLFLLADRTLSVLGVLAPGLGGT